MSTASSGSSSGALDAASVKERLRRSLPAHLIPSAVVTLERLPLMASGKLDRRALQGLANAPTATLASSEPPKNPTEETIAEIWAEVLEVDVADRRTNFFDHGGHSLLLLKVQDRLAAVLGVELPVTDLFQYPTVEALACHLAAVAKPASAVAESGRDRASARRRALAGKQELKAAFKSTGKAAKSTLKSGFKSFFKGLAVEPDDEPVDEVS